MLIFLTMIDADEDREKFISIYNNYRKLMFYIAKSILHNDQDAEDVVQEAFYKVAENISKISDPDCTKTKNFVVIIVERKALDILKCRKKTDAEYIDEVYHEGESGLDYEQILEGVSSLARCIRKLPANYREVIILKYYFGYNLKEISELLGLTLNYARQIDQRAKKRLREICKEEGYDI